MKNLICFSLLFLAIYSCRNKTSHKSPAATDTAVVVTKAQPTALSRQDSILAVGRQILIALKENQFSALRPYLSEKGILISPYAHIDRAQCTVLKIDELLLAVQKNQLLNWGHYDGTGKPIRLTVKEYFKKFVYNADYLNAEAVSVNEIIKQGNSMNNLDELFPQNPFIDYHFSGFDQKLNGMDWTTLRLVFEQQNGEFFLFAIVHDQWTI